MGASQTAITSVFIVVMILFIYMAYRWLNQQKTVRIISVPRYEPVYLPRYRSYPRFRTHHRRPRRPHTRPR